MSHSHFVVPAIIMLSQAQVAHAQEISVARAVHNVLGALLQHPPKYRIQAQALGDSNGLLIFTDREERVVCKIPFSADIQGLRARVLKTQMGRTRYIFNFSNTPNPPKIFRSVVTSFRIDFDENKNVVSFDVWYGKDSSFGGIYPEYE